MKQNITVDENEIELHGSARIIWMYPKIYDEKKNDSIILEMCNIRAVNQMRITFDARKNKYIIEQPTRFSWGIEDDVCDPEWEEVACIDAFETRREKQNINPASVFVSPILHGSTN